MEDELDTCTLERSDDGGVCIVRDDCNEEVARYGWDGDCLSAFPGLDQDELNHCGRVVRINAYGIRKGRVVFFGFTPVSA